MNRPSCARLALLLAGLALFGCQKRRDSSAPLRLGFFPNVTHAQALVGNADGTFSRALGGKLETVQFNSGPSAMEAIAAGSLDVSYVGSGPAINMYVKSGRELRIVAGAMNGGAVLVTKTAKSPEELVGKRVASPQLGNTQDIALRHWLKQKGLPATSSPGGAGVRVTPLANADILSMFIRGEIEGAWVPEPWGARLVAAGGHILVNEQDLWPNGQFPTTVLVTTRKFIEARPQELKALLRAHVELTARWKRDPALFATQVNDAFERITRQRLPDEVLKEAFSRVDPTLDPLPSALGEAAKHAKELGYLSSDDLSTLVDLSLLRQVQTEQVSR